MEAAFWLVFGENLGQIRFEIGTYVPRPWEAVIARHYARRAQVVVHLRYMTPSTVAKNVERHQCATRNGTGRQEHHMPTSTLYKVSIPVQCTLTYPKNTIRFVAIPVRQSC